MDITADATELPEIPGDPLALERQVCFALSIAARSVLSVYRPLLEPMGLTHPQYLVMLALWGQSPLAVKELIEMLQLDGPTLSPLLKRLEAAGLVTRTRDPEDERQLRIDSGRPRGRAGLWEIHDKEKDERRYERQEEEPNKIEEQHAVERQGNSHNRRDRCGKKRQ